MFLWSIPNFSKVLGDCAMGSTVLFSYEGRMERSLRPRGRGSGFRLVAGGRDAMFSVKKKEVK